MTQIRKQCNQIVDKNVDKLPLRIEVRREQPQGLLERVLAADRACQLIASVLEVEPEAGRLEIPNHWDPPKAVETLRDRFFNDRLNVGASPRTHIGLGLAAARHLGGTRYGLTAVRPPSLRRIALLLIAAAGPQTLGAIQQRLPIRGRDAGHPHGLAQDCENGAGDPFDDWGQGAGPWVEA